MNQVVNQVAALRNRVEHWRQHGGGKGTRMPEDLWKKAAEIARVEGVYATSRALRVNYQGLKSRLTHTNIREPACDKTATFVEVELKQPGDPGKTVVELFDERGRRIRIDVTGASAVDVMGLAQAFWRQGQ